MLPIIKTLLSKHYNISAHEILPVGDPLLNSTYKIKTPDDRVYYFQKNWGVRDQIQLLQSVQLANFVYNQGGPVINFVDPLNSLHGVYEDFEFWKLSEDCGEKISSPTRYNYVTPCLTSLHSFHTIAKETVYQNMELVHIDDTPLSVYTIIKKLSLLVYKNDTMFNSGLEVVFSQDDLIWIINIMNELLSELPNDNFILHGDPKIQNFAYYNGIYKLIDFESACIGPLWIDLGDFVRSFTQSKTTELEYHYDEEIFNNVLKKVCTLYEDLYPINRKLLHKAVALITLRLTAHMIIDVFQGKYFRQLSCVPKRRSYLLNIAKTQFRFAQAIMTW